MKKIRLSFVLSALLLSLALGLSAHPAAAAPAATLPTSASAPISAVPQSVEPVVLYGTSSPLQPATASVPPAGTGAASPQAASQASMNLLRVNRLVPRLARA